MKLLNKIAITLLFITPLAQAGNPEAAEEKPHMVASRTVTMGAVVDAVNYETREVTLSGEGGQVTFTASPDVRNLSQVEPGDHVLAELFEEISISVHANTEGAEPGSGLIQAEARAQPGEMPAGGMMDTMIITAVVEDINIEANTFKLRYEDGRVEEYTARNPDNLRRSEVGDIVVIAITQAMGIMVEHPAPE
jgi:hypothetical protein